MSREPRRDGVMAERDLWCAVIHRAMDDALTPLRESSASNASVKPHEVTAARAWFCTGGRYFRQVCEMAGMEPSAIQKRVVALIEAQRASEMQAECAQ